MVLVDTSVWVDLLRGRSNPESGHLAALLEQMRDIAVCGLVRQEILQGIRDDVTARRVRNLLDQAHYLYLREPDTFDQAARLYRDLRRGGRTIRSSVDCLIAALAIREDIPLLHRDRDFVTIAGSSSLKLYKPVRF